ncbi:zinc finger protein [Fusarium napiforme]|uniref:Zinc finger protein n=1 Tax=Fusarium napiforme TaxID=42672 RepID=A0A8H5II72_9HYPO|nr:zinc finger protein [Fusarium napiforme]
MSTNASTAMPPTSTLQASSITREPSTPTFHLSALIATERYFCAYKDDPDVRCDRSFSRLTGARTHAQVEHEGKEKEEFPCPGAVDYECEKTFTLKSNATKHYLSSHIRPEHECEHCDVKSTSIEYMRKHQKVHTHKFACPRPLCQHRFKTSDEALRHAGDPSHRQTVKQYLYLKKHWKTHVKKRHVSSKVEPTYTPAEARPFRRLALFNQIYTYAGESLLNKDDEDSDTLVAEESHLDEDLETQDLDLPNEGDLEALEIDNDKLFTKSHRSIIMSENADWWESWLTLSSRCIKCQTIHKIKRKVKDMEDMLGKKKTTNFAPLKKMLDVSIQEQWSTPEDYKSRVQNRVQEIKEGSRAGTDLVILDDEYSMFYQREPRLLEFSMIERVSGRVIIDTLVKHTSCRESRPRSKIKELRHLRMLSEKYERCINARSGRLQKLDVHEIAARLKQSGISPDTIVLMWHCGRTDLQLLRKFLEDAGYTDILPPDENCIPLIPLFRTNLSYKRFPQKFSLALEVLFPVLYPGSGLRGRNHRAIIDCHQTRYVCEALDEFSRPVAERGVLWRPEKFEKVSQKAIRDYYPPESDGQKKDSEKRATPARVQGTKEKRPQKRL